MLTGYQQRRIYCDTSVFGGCYDVEFAAASNEVFRLIREGTFVLVVSQIGITELVRAPFNVRGIVLSLPVQAVEFVAESPEITLLASAYIEAGILN